MKYLSFFKWDLYAGIKRRVLNGRILKSLNNKMVIILLGILAVIRILISYGVTISFPDVLKISQKGLINIEIIDSLINGILAHTELVIGLLILYVLITVLKKINDVSKLTYSNRYIEWVSANTHFDKSKIIFCIAGNYNILESNDLFTILLPIFVGCFKNMGYSLTKGILYGFLITVIIFMTVYICAMWKYVMLLNKKNDNIKQRVIFNAAKIVAIMFVFSKIGGYFSEWMNRFPLIKRRVEGEEFSIWVNEIKEKITSGFPNIEGLMADVYGNITEGKLITIILGLALILYISAIYIGGYIVREDNARDYKQVKVMPNSMAKGYYFRSILRSGYLKRNIKYLFGGNLFWIFIGFYGGLMTGIREQKVLFFLLMTCVFYAGLFLTQGIIHRLNAIYTLDGEGKKAYFWISDLGRLLALKERVWLFNVAAITVVEYLFFYICTKNTSVILAFGLQLVYMAVLLLLYNLPSVIFPYFEYKNKEELVKYCDREKLYDLIEGILLIVVNSIMVIPTALYMTDFMGIGRYIIVQFFAVGLIMALAGIIIGCFIKKKIRSIEYLQRIYCS